MFDMMTKGRDTVLKWQEADPTEPGTWPKRSSPMTKETTTTEVRAIISILEDAYTELNLWLSSSSNYADKTPQDVFSEVANIQDARSFLDEAIDKLEKIESAT